MRVPSRNMPKRRQQTMGWFSGSLVLVICLGVLALPGLFWWPLAFVLPLLSLRFYLVSERRDARIAESRSGESICSFARSFDCRKIDTWIVRAVFEEFTCQHPIRASDSFEDDLQVDLEDLEWSVEAIADRIGRSLDNYEKNPMYDKLQTVHDLVMFFHFQPTLQRQNVDLAIGS